MPENHFGEATAARYDASSPAMFDPAVVDPAVDFLAEMAGDGPVLELGIGTGRIALPLAGRGPRVHGIELSEAMIAQLRAKDGAETIGVTVGDFAHATAPGSYALAYLVFNTIGNLTSQDEQVACFRNVAAHLAPGGRFVIENGVPSLQWLPPGERVRPFTVTPTELGFDEYDVATQRMWSHHYWLEDGRWHTQSVPFRYTWPAELDLMARIAGLSLRERWNDWDRRPFTNDSRQHVSVWEKPA